MREMEQFVDKWLWISYISRYAIELWRDVGTGLYSTYPADTQHMVFHVTHSGQNKMAATLACESYNCIYFSANFCSCIQIRQKLRPESLIDNKPTLLQIIARPLSKSILVYFTDAYMRHSASLYSDLVWFGNIIISMASCKTAVSPLLTHWRYCSLALSHRYFVDSWDISIHVIQRFVAYTEVNAWMPSWQWSEH